jgi:hypothetical protein
VVAVWISRTGADADLWGHLRFGADLLASHSLSVADRYSFTADTAWINHEWLSEAVLAGIYDNIGALGLNLLKLAIIGGIAFLTWRTGKAWGGSRFALSWLTALVVAASYTRTQVLRPQAFSVLFFTILLVLLQGLQPNAAAPPPRGSEAPGWERRWGGGRLAIALAALFTVWANAHGGWIVGFATLALWVAFDVFEQRTVRACVLGSGLIVAALAGTLVTPYGTKLWMFLHQTVGLSRDDITDWTPFAKYPIGLIVFELVLPAVALLSMRVSRRWPSARHAAVIGMLAFGMSRVGRVDAFMQVAIGILLAPILVDSFGRVEEALRRQRRLGTPYVVHGVVAVAMAIVTAAVAVTRLGHIYIEGTWIPDRDAVRFLRAGSPNTRLLTWFSWGEYAIWHLSARGILVSMDGRRETIYSDRVLADHWAFYKNQGNNATAYPDAIKADQIWLPKDLPIVPVLRDRGWHVAFESDVSIVFSRSAEPSRVTSGSDPTSERTPAFFPGP